MRPLSLYTLINRRQRWIARQKLRLPAILLQPLWIVGAAACLMMISVFVITGVMYASLTKDLPSIEILQTWLNPRDGLLLEPTRIYDRSGQRLLDTLENPGIERSYLFLNPQHASHFSPMLVNMTVASQDPAFYQEAGIAWENLLSPEPQTLAETLVSDLLLDQEPAGVRRALRMRLLAAQVIRQYGHAQVLEWILNCTYYGHRAYGADSAARLYLDKSASELTLAEIALLVAAAESPALNPLDAPAAALERQQVLLDEWHAGMLIGDQEYQAAKNAQISLRLPPEEPSRIAMTFTRQVTNQLIAGFGRQRIERGGLRIVTTLDYDLQLQLSCILQTQLLRLEDQMPETGLPDDKNCIAASLLPTINIGELVFPVNLEGSAVILDPASGEVLAMLGDTSVLGEGNVVSQHDPGSLLAPFVAMAAFGRGLSPASLLWDIPQNVPSGLEAYQSQEMEYRGPTRLRTALANDYLTPIAKILVDMGASNVWRLTIPLGLPDIARSEKPNALLYGGGKVTLLEIAQAYATLANQGRQIGKLPIRSSSESTELDTLKPSTIISVEDVTRRRWLEEGAPQEKLILSQQLSFLVHHVLSDENSRRATLGYPNALEIGRPAGVKIGQTADGLQVWIAGYTPQRLVVVWLGLPTGSDPGMRLEPRMAAGVWHAIMQYTHRGLPIEGWQTPAGVAFVDVCDPSGLLPTAACPGVVKEVFLEGSEPSTRDNLYRRVEVNRETRLLATVFTPLELVEERTYLVPPEEASAWAQSVGLPAPPASYDTVQPPQPSPDAGISEPQLFAYVAGKIPVRGSAGGERFDAYRLQVGQGLNPRSWQQIGADGISMVYDDILGEWDTTQQGDGLYALRLLVIRSDQSIQSAITQVTVDNTPPVIQSYYPAAGQTLSSQVTVEANVTDSVGVNHVTWYVDGRQVAEVSHQPFVHPIQISTGKHTLKVEATDLAGNETLSEIVTFTVD